MRGWYDVIIIGSGPAGLTAGIYTARANLQTLLFAGERWGGQLMLTTEVENFPGFPEGIMGPELMRNMRRQAERFGVEVVDEEAKEIEIGKRPFAINGREARAVIVATGAEFKWLGLESEQRLLGRGVSGCATCDGAFFKGKKVVVVGGGDSAMEEASFLTKFASEVVVVHRRDQFRASKIMQDRVLASPKINVLWSTEVVEVLGETKVEGVRLKSQMPGVKNQGNVNFQNAKVVFRTDKEVVWDMNADGLFVAIGHTPMTRLFEGKLETDGRGYIIRRSDVSDTGLPGEGAIAGFKTMTSVEGVFAAGDVCDYSYRQAITAAGYGCEAALDAERWLASRGLGDMGSR